MTYFSPLIFVDYIPLFSSPSEAEFLQKLVREKIKHSTFKYIDDVLSNNSCYFHSYVDSIYPGEIKDHTGFTSSVSYFDYFIGKGH